jgi:hypothetical protein
MKGGDKNNSRSRTNGPNVKVNFSKRVSYPTLFVGSSRVCADRATEIESIRESVDDGFKLAPKLTTFLTGSSNISRRETMREEAKNLNNLPQRRRPNVIQRPVTRMMK